MERLRDLQVRQKPKVPTAAVCSEHVELRRELLTLIQLQKQVEYHPVSWLRVTSVCNFNLVLEHHCQKRKDTDILIIVIQSVTFL